MTQLNNKPSFPAGLQFAGFLDGALGQRRSFFLYPQFLAILPYFPALPVPVNLVRCSDYGRTRQRH